MSAARSQFIQSLQGLSAAASLDAITSGSTTTVVNPGVSILRRGILIAALIALETFIRDRTAELIDDLGQWPAKFEDLPQSFRDAALLDSLSHLQRYATMLKRQNENYELEITSEIKRMSSNIGPSFQFTKFIAGDYTGNISDRSLKALLGIFQIKDCWAKFRTFSSEIGLGFPSVDEVMKEVVKKRHRSAHAAAFIPSATDITGLEGKLFCLGICFDVSMSSSIELALVKWKNWADGSLDWRSAVDLYFIDKDKDKYRLKKSTAKKSIRVLSDKLDAPKFIPKGARGTTSVLVWRDEAQIPREWTLI